MSDFVQLVEKLWDKSDLSKATSTKLLINLRKALVSFNLDLISFAKKKNSMNSSNDKKRIDTRIQQIKKQMLIYLSLWNINVQQRMIDTDSIKYSLGILLNIDYRLIKGTLRNYLADKTSPFYSDAKSCQQLFQNVLK